MELGRTDTSDATALYVPSIGLVVSGDCIYNNTHPYLAECNEEASGEWLRYVATSNHYGSFRSGHGASVDRSLRRPKSLASIE